jgi:hypothetical protein
MKRWSEVPPLFRFLAVNCFIGIAASWLFLAGFLWLDISGLRGLLANSPDGAVALALLAGGFAVTFGSASMATAVWLMPYDADHGGRTLRFRPQRPATLRPVPVRADRTTPRT